MAWLFLGEEKDAVSNARDHKDLKNDIGNEDYFEVRSDGRKLFAEGVDPAIVAKVFALEKHVGAEGVGEEPRKAR